MGLLMRKATLEAESEPERLPAAVA